MFENLAVGDKVAVYGGYGSGALSQRIVERVTAATFIADGETFSRKNGWKRGSSRVQSRPWTQEHDEMLARELTPAQLAMLRNAAAGKPLNSWGRGSSSYVAIMRLALVNRGYLLNGKITAAGLAALQEALAVAIAGCPAEEPK